MNAILMRLYRWNWLPYLFLLFVGSYVAYDVFVPVLTMEGKIVVRGPDYVDLHIVGTKWRYCGFVDVQGYTAFGDSPKKIARIKRVDDIPQTRATRPTGTLDIGVWRVWPTDNADRVIVYTQHDCGGDLRASKVAEIRL